MYPIESKPASHNAWYTPAESNAYYRARYAREGVTIHWWGDGTGAGNHDNIVNYILGQAQAGVKSANYVLSDNKITMLVNPDNVAWCSQGGNPTTVSIEFQPTLGAEGYKKGGWLIWQLEKRYGHTLTLYPHSHWFTTSCPGTVSLSRLRAEADKWKAGGYGNEMITDKNQATLLWKMLRPNTTVQQGWIDSLINKRTYANFVAGATNEIAQRDASLRAQAQLVTSLNATVAQLKAQDLNDQAATKTALDQVASLTSQLSQCQANITQLGVTPADVSNASDPSLVGRLFAAILSVFKKS